MKTGDVPISVRISLLGKAAELLKKIGWCQGTMKNARGNVCLLGALSDMCGDHFSDNGGAPQYCSLQLDLHETLIADGFPPEDAGVVKWNDRDGRTADEVLALIDRTITRLQEIP